VVSIIIPAYNEESLLGRTLDAVNEAVRNVDPYEIIVVDDASTDRTAAIATEHGARVICVNCRQISKVRNAGARGACGDMLIFVDADTIVNSAVVEAAVETMRNGAVGGGCALRFDGRVPLYGRAIEALSIPVYRAIGLASGCFLFCTRVAFERAGGFDERLFAAEEGALSLALGRLGRFVVLPQKVITSGRKLRAYAPREVLGLLARIALGGPKSVQKKDGLDLWYGPRRQDPA
jgi:glycosyltransferase involved in cell wall biosynthesis